MLIYSHLVIASILEPYVKPRQIEEYYLGSIAPDIRYYAGIPRSQTHIPNEEIVKFVARYPLLESFVLGYLIHCASENLPGETGLQEAVLKQFPLSLQIVQHKLPKNFVSVLLTFYHLENYHSTIRVSETGNEMLRQLGLHDEIVKAFASMFNRFLEEPTFTTGMSVLSDLGLLGNAGVNKYLRIANIIKNRFLKLWLFSLMNGPIANFHQKSILILLPLCEPLTLNRMSDYRDNPLVHLET